MEGAGGAPAGALGFWVAEGGGGREMEASVASMAAWMAEDGTEDWVLGMGMDGVDSSDLKSQPTQSSVPLA